MPSPLKRLAVKLSNCKEEDLPSDLLAELRDVASNAEQEMIKRAGEFLHDIGIERHNEKEINAVIEAFPAAVLHKDDAGRLPIQVAARFNSMQFIPHIAQSNIHSQFEMMNEGDKRGGLLCNLVDDYFNRNVIQCITNQSSDKIDHDYYDCRCVEVLHRLRETNLLLKEDIEKMNLLLYSFFPASQRRFDYLADWYPRALRISKWKGKPLIHAAIGNRTICSFEIVLRANMRHFPSKVGFLFCKFEGKTACQAACEKYGIHETMGIIKKIVPPSENIPILHHVVKHAPKYLHDFKIRYPEAVNLRDSKGRLLIHTQLYYGGKTFLDDSKFFTTASNYDVAERDPVTGLFPFMIAASENKCDLTGVYTLCRKRPDMFEGSDNSTEMSYFSFVEEERPSLCCFFRRQCTRRYSKSVRKI